MSGIATDTLWPQVEKHEWKWRPRTRRITGILWHSTRGGQWYDGDTELGAYMNWVRSPNNRVAFAGGDYAGIASYGIGPGRIVECVPDDRMPAWSSWPSDEHALSVEVAQSNPGQAIEAATIEACVRFARWAAATYGIPLVRVWPERDQEWSGMAGHEDTQQGRAQGKSDPGREFWAPFLAALEEDGMKAEELARMERLERLVAGNHLTTEVWAGNVADLQAVGISDPIVGTAIALSGEQALAYADRRGFSLALGVKLARDEAAEAAAELREHTANHAAGATGPVAQHSHEGGTTGGVKR